MRLGRVVGTVVSTIKVDALTGHKLMLVANVDPSAPQGQTGGGDVYVATDLAGAGEGDIVLVTLGSAARTAETTSGVPTDATIVGIIDSVQYDNKTTFSK
jgi:microcompartment protein CcmK/EutM